MRYAFCIPNGPRMLRKAKGRVVRAARRYTPPLSRTQLISGITKDSSGNPLASCTVMLYRTSDNLMREVVISDSAGAYTFSAINDGAQYYAVAYKVGGTDVAGTTVNTLVGA